jgi:hypothetical protein
VLILVLVLVVVVELTLLDVLPTVIPPGVQPPRFMWYGRAAIDAFCSTHGITRIVRGHTMAAEVRGRRCTSSADAASVSVTPSYVAPSYVAPSYVTPSRRWQGVRVAKGGRVITVFSDSKDHAVKGKVGWLLIEDNDGTGACVRFHARQDPRV